MIRLLILADGLLVLPAVVVYILTGTKAARYA